LSDTIISETAEIQLPRHSRAGGRQIVRPGFPKTALKSIIKRNGKFIVPNGSTVLNEGDTLLVIVPSKSSLKRAYEALEIESQINA
jgi:cell volume regulation protein A